MTVLPLFSAVAVLHVIGTIWLIWTVIVPFVRSRTRKEYRDD